MALGNRRTFLVTLGSLALVATVLSGCVVEPRREVVEVVAPRAPPPPRVEIAPPPPRPVEVVVWEPGHWHWDGREYVWVTGRYIDRPHRQAEWEPGHWRERGDRWVWIPGHWR